MIPWLISLRLLPGRLFPFSWVGSTALIALPEGKQWSAKESSPYLFVSFMWQGEYLRWSFFTFRLISNHSQSSEICKVVWMHLTRSYTLIDPYQQLWKAANLMVYAQPCAGRCRLPPTSYQGGQAWASSNLRERLPRYLVTLGYRWPVITSKLYFIRCKLPLKILHLLLLCICLDVPLAFGLHTKAHCSAVSSLIGRDYPCWDFKCWG